MGWSHVPILQTRRPCAPMNDEEPTPLTDAEATDGWSCDAICVSIDFARELERKLIAKTKELNKLMGIAEEVAKRPSKLGLYEDAYFKYEAAFHELSNEEQNRYGNPLHERDSTYCGPYSLAEFAYCIEDDEEFYARWWR